MRSGGRERTAFLPFPKTCLWNKSVPSPFAKGSKTMSRQGVCSSSPVSAPLQQKGSKTCGPCGKVGSGMPSAPAGEGGRVVPRQAHGAMGNAAHDFQGRRRGQDNPSEVPVPCPGGQGNCFRSQVSCLNEEFGIWPRADEPDAEPVCRTPKQSLLQSLQSILTAKVSLEKVKQEGKGKRWGEGCAFCTCWVWSEELQRVLTKKAESRVQQAFPTDTEIKQAGKTGNTAFELTRSTFYPITCLKTKLLKIYISTSAQFKAKSIPMSLRWGSLLMWTLIFF